MITVVSRKKGFGVFYIGRGSPLGNPFVMKDHSEAERNSVCDSYEVYIRDKIAARDPVIINELNRLLKVAKSQDIELSCFCAPRRCHGDTIKRLLEEKL